MKMKANLIIYDKVKDEIEVFLSLRSKTATMFPNYFSFYGGKIEDGETAEGALIRELREELELKLDSYSFLGEYKTPGAIKNVFYSRVSKNVVDKLIIHEGQDGKWFNIKMITSEKKLIKEDKEILKTFFKRLIGKNNSSNLV